MVVGSFRRVSLATYSYRKTPIIALSIFCPPQGGKGCAYPPLQRLALRLAPAPQRSGGFAPRRPAAAAPLPREQGGTMYLCFPWPGDRQA